ncbi:MAG: CHAD domain-containing protein [Herpetosiphonaceae bacterium]|nr:CHAD domain-containing protein [Herpetosiphonaceae bacterium]
MEREAKYRAVKRIRPKQIEDLDFAPYRLGERETAELRDTVLDTAERTLSNQRYALRVRRTAEQVLLTFKSPGSVSGAVHSRPEIEVEIPAADRTNRSHWPAAIAAPVQELAGNAKLHSLLSIRNRRRTWLVSRDGVLVAEIALDRGTIAAEGRSLPFHEVEIELKGEGGDSDLAALEAVLTAGLPLVPEERSKMKRGLLLLDHNERADAIKLAAESTPMSATASLAEAGRTVLAQHLQKLHTAWPIARAGEDPEGVHQMRVATRRLRAVLAALAETVYDPAEVRKLRRGLRIWATTLGEVRDPDVFLAALDSAATQLPPESAAELAPLRTVLIERRERGRKALLDLLDSKKTAAFAERLDDFVLTEGAGVRESTAEEAEQERTLVRHWAGTLLWSHYERVRAYEVGLGAAAFVTLHHLRIEIKHLRYTLELFRDALGDEAAALHKLLVAAQDHLGSIQDAQVAIDLVDLVLLEHPDSTLLHTYRAQRVTERDHLAASASDVVGQIIGLPFRRRLASLISKL